METDVTSGGTGAAVPRTEPATFNYPVHGARGLFSLMVFVFHVVNSGLATLPILAAGWPLYLLRSTEYGVELFFCISGFVICGTLRRARSPAAFLQDRVIRIYPALSASILLITVVGLVTGLGGFQVETSELFWRVPANMLALPGIVSMNALHPAAWSLSYEMSFYLTCAALWWLRSAWGMRAVWLAAPLAAVPLALYPRGLFLLCGVLVAEGFVQHRRLAPLVRRPLPCLLAFLVLWHEIQMLTLPRHIIATTLFEWAADLRLGLAALAFAAATLAFAGIAAGRGGLSRLLRTRLLQYLGTISYSFYLWHPIVMSGVKAVMKQSGLAGVAGDGAQAVFLLLALPPSLLVAHVSQRVLERRIGGWLRRRLHHPMPMGAPADAATAR